MKAIKYLVAGALVLGLSAPVMAQNANYKDLLKPIETSLKANPNMDAKSLTSLLKDYKKEFKKDPKALVALGEALRSNKKFDAATEVANMAIARDKNFGDAYILLGDIEATKDDGGDAAMWYQQAMTMDPKNPEGYMRYANIYRKRSPEESEKALAELHKQRPDFPVEAETANNFYIGEKYDKAVEYFDKADKNKLSEYYLMEYALSSYLTNQKEKSLDLVNFGINKYPKDATYYRIGLWDAVDLQKYEEAIAKANTLMATDSIKKTARDHAYYGLALKGNKQYTEAIAQFEKSFELNNTDYKPYQYIAETYTEMGQEDKALEYNQKYMENNPNAAPSDYVKLANIYIGKTKKEAKANKPAAYQKVINVYNKLAEKYPALAYYADFNIADEAFRIEDLDDTAIEYYKKTIDILKDKADKDDSEKYSLKQSYFGIGYILWASKNDLEASKPYFQEVIKLDPENKVAKQALGLDQSAEGAQQ